MDLDLQFMPVQWDSNEGLNHPIINVHFGLLNKEQHLFWGIVMLGDKATDLCFLSKSFFFGDHFYFDENLYARHIKAFPQHNTPTTMLHCGVGLLLTSPFFL